MPTIRLSKRMAAWATAVVGTLGSAAGAYTVVGKPFQNHAPTAEASSAASDAASPSLAQPLQTVPIPDDALRPADGERYFPAEPTPPRRPTVFLDPAVARASHNDPVSSSAAGRSAYGFAARQTPDQPPEPAIGPAIASPTFDSPTADPSASQAAGERRLPQFEPPTSGSLQSAWSAGPAPDSSRSAVSLSPPTPLIQPAESAPADLRSSDSAPTERLPVGRSSDEDSTPPDGPGGALSQAARAAIADGEPEPPGERSAYLNAASARLDPIPANADTEPGQSTPDSSPTPSGSNAFLSAPTAPHAAPAQAGRDDRTLAAPAADAAAVSARSEPRPIGASDVSPGDGVPGAEAMDGVQTPTLTFEKLAPPEIQVGKEATFQIHVRNTGQTAAHGVTIVDRVPKGTEFVTATPAPTRVANSQLTWELGTLQPGEETTVSLQLMPVSEGEIGSVAQVQFQANASARALCTRPQLSVTQTGPKRALIGEAVVFDISVTNPGSGVATGVVLEEDVPSGLTHAAGRELEFEIGALRPNETRQLQLTLKADKPGIVRNEILARGDANLIARHAAELEVVAPDLEVRLDGPRMRYLDRPATYEVVISNPGTATAREVELVTYLPKGMQFVSADHKGQYEPQNHAVYWSLEEMPAQQTGAAKLTVLPVQTGVQKLRLEARAELGLQESFEQAVQVESVAELQFTLADEADPIEVGAETSYLITLTNSGSSAATNVQLEIRLPPELKPLGGDGPTRVAVADNQLQIDPLARIGPTEQAVYRIKAQGAAAGHQRVQVRLSTAEMPVPIMREEVTQVYEDR